MENKILKTIILILTAIFGGAVTELTDDKIKIPIIERADCPEIPALELVTECPAATNVIAYMCNGDKYYGKCNRLGPSCELTKSDEILTKIG